MQQGAAEQPLISADSHINEPRDLWETRLTGRVADAVAIGMNHDVYEVRIVE